MRVNVLQNIDKCTSGDNRQAVSCCRAISQLVVRLHNSLVQGVYSGTKAASVKQGVAGGARTTPVVEQRLAGAVYELKTLVDLAIRQALFSTSPL